MKIAYVVNTYPKPSHSFIRREIHALERRGIKVHRFAMRGDRAALVDAGDIEEHTRTEHVLDQGAAVLAQAAVMAFRAPRRAFEALRLAFGCGVRASAILRHMVYFAEAAYLAQRCQALGVEHVHAHFGTNSTTVAMLSHALGGPGFSFTAHGPEEFDAPKALSLGKKLHRAAFGVAISSYGRSQLCRWARPEDWDRIKVVHCGIEPALFADPAPLPDMDRGLRLIAIGRLTEQKGLLGLIPAMTEARARGAQVHLTLVGDGEMRAAIEAAIRLAGLAPHVTLTGWVDEARVRAELAAAHALVLPSFAEGLPMVVMEAMASGRVVLATYIAGIPELVLPGETGFLVPAGDTEALTEALVTLANTTPEHLKTMGHAARARVLMRHDVDIEAKKLGALFAEAIADSAS